MKVLYISMPPFLDVDLSLIQHLSKHCDVHYLMDLPPYYKSSSALRIDKMVQKDEIISAKDYEELHQFSDFIPLEKWNVINRTSPKQYAPTNLLLQTRILDFVNNLNPDVIHCANFLDENFYYFLFRNKRKILLTVHDPFPHSGESTFRKETMRKFNYTFIKNIILLNSVQKNDFVRYTPYRFSSIFISSLGIYEYLRLYKAPESKDSTFRILFFGRISPYKGIDTLLSAFESIENEYDNIELVIAGNGKFWFDTTTYQSNPRITFLNRYVPNEKLVQLLTSCSVVVCPYKDATQSGVVMSAYALNKPVIGTLVGALPEMIREGKTGILVPPDNIPALAQALKKVINNPYLLKDMENNITQEYNTGIKGWEYITLELFNHYLKLI